MFSRALRNISVGLPRDGFFKAGLFVSVLQGLSAVALLGTSAWLISRAAEVNSIVYLGLGIVGVRGFAVGRAAFRYVERLLLHESAFRMLGERRPQIFRAIAPFIPAGMAEKSRGETISRAVSDVDELQNLPLRVLAPLVQAIVVSIVATLFVFALLPQAGIGLLLTLTSGFLIAIPVSSRMSRRGDEVIAPLKAQLASQTLDLLENQDVYLAYGWMQNKRELLARTDQLLQRAFGKTAVSNGLGLALFSLLASLAMICSAWFGGQALEGGSIPGATLAVLILLPMAIFEVVQGAQPAASAFRRFNVSAGRVNEILQRDVPVELDLVDGKQELANIQNIELTKADIGYPSRQSNILNQIDLKLALGEVVLLSGASGSGKSSIALVIARLLNLRDGLFRINDQPASEFSLESIHRNIGLVEQNPSIFVGDVRANLLLAKPDATDFELISMLERVGLWSMFAIRAGLQTQLGDRGVLISGGEAQRLALARALLADFKVLILDEPTANVDQGMADVLVSDLLSAARSNNRAILLISHEDRYRRLVDREVRL